MSVVSASKVRGIPDYAPAVVLRNVADGAETSTQTETAVSLNELRTAYWHNKEIPHGSFEVFVHVTARQAGGTTPVNGYTFSLLVDDTANMSDSPVTIASFVVPSTGVYRLVVDSKSIPVLDPDVSGAGKWIAARMTIAGNGSPSITYGAWIGKVLGA
jgi:hypothetical protein